MGKYFLREVTETINIKYFLVLYKHLYPSNAQYISTLFSSSPRMDITD